MKTGVIEAFNASHCYFHKDIAPLLEEIAASPMYSAIVVDFDRHAVAGTGLWSLEKSGVTSKRYAAAAAVRHARSKVRANIYSYGLPYAIGFYEEAVPGPVGTLLALWKVPDSADARSDLRQNSAVMFASSRVKHFLSRHQTAIYSRCIVEIGKSRGSLKISSATALLDAFGFSHHRRSDADDCRVAKALSAILSYSSQLACCDDNPTLDLARDLRNYNHRKKEPLLKAFFSAAADYLNHAVNSTGAQVDQRRAPCEGAARMYMPIALSLQDLMNSIRIHAESVLKLRNNIDFILPSQEWLRLQFQPPRVDNLTAAKFTGLLGLHRAVQKRTIRANHEDSHFTRALWKYVRYWCHPLASNGFAAIISVDDKCGVKIGEPAMPISALQRRRMSYICVSDTMNVATINSSVKQGVPAADHDYSVVTLTPSVTMFIDPPSQRSGSFMRGAAYLTLKNAVFESSNPLRHAAELSNSLRHRYPDKTIPPVLVVFSDGGSDHRTNLYSVQLSFFWLMVELNLDEVVCVRTAPGDSWVNPAERKMAELNIAWESASFARMSAHGSLQVPKDHANWFENAVKSANSMSGIRALQTHRDVIANDIDVPAIVAASVAPVIDAMKCSVERLNTNVNEKWSVMKSSTSSECEKVMQFLKSEVYDGLDFGKLQASIVEGTSAEELLSAHKIESSRYSFHLRKRLSDGKSRPCKASCPLCGMGDRLPSTVLNVLRPVPFPVLGEDGSYKQFDDLYAIEGAEERPPNAETRLAPRTRKMAMSGTCCRGMLQCANCDRPRALYCRTKVLFDSSIELLKASKNELTFVCGTYTPFSDSLALSHPEQLRQHPASKASGSSDVLKCLEAVRKSVYIQNNLSCNDDVEDSLYVSPYIPDEKKQMCCFCGVVSGSLSRQEREVDEQTRLRRQGKKQTSRPFCARCRKERIPRYPRTRKRNTSEKETSSNRKPRKAMKRTSCATTTAPSLPQAPDTAVSDIHTVRSGGSDQAANDIYGETLSAIPNNHAPVLQPAPPSHSETNPQHSTHSPLVNLAPVLQADNRTTGVPTYNPAGLHSQHLMANLQRNGYSESGTPHFQRTTLLPQMPTYNHVQRCLSHAPQSRTAQTNSQLSNALITIACAAGVHNCVFARRGEYSTPSHQCKNQYCPRRGLGLHNLCNYLHIEPSLLPRNCEFEGVEQTFFCSRSCITSYIERTVRLID